MTDASLGVRLAALDRVAAYRAVLPAELAAEVDALRARATERLARQPDRTVAVLAGGSGSGKSSLFNALVGLTLSPAGVRRPTTTAPIACVYGPADAGPLLDWLGVEPRDRLTRWSALDPTADADLAGLVLVDLPDHDTVLLEHRDVVDRLVATADLVLWVVDPQKYADALGHERYLRPLRHHRGVVTVVLNHADRLAPPARDVVLDDVRRLLASDESTAQVLVTSTVTGEGVAGVRAVLAAQVAAGRASTQRLAADLDALAGRLARTVGSPVSADARAAVYARLVDDLSAALDVPGVAVRVAHGAPLQLSVPTAVVEGAVDRAVQGLAESLPPGVTVEARAAARAAAHGLPDELVGRINRLDARALRPRRRLFGGGERARAAHATAVTEALRSAVRESVAPVREALDSVVRPRAELAEAVRALRGE